MAIFHDARLMCMIMLIFFPNKKISKDKKTKIKKSNKAINH